MKKLIFFVPCLKFFINVVGFIMNEFKAVSLEKSKGRILVTSDIHGHFDHLMQLLKIAEFSSDDILIVNGDIVEKGPQSLAVVRYIKSLCEAGRAIALMGNVDNRFLWQLDNITDYNSAKDFLNYLFYMRDWIGTSFFDEMSAEVAKIPTTVDELIHVLDVVRSRFIPELEFIRDLPTMLETPNYIFVHGGIPESEQSFVEKTFESVNRHKCIKFDRYLDYVHDNKLEFERNIVVGHWPVVNYNASIRIMNPIIDKESKVISIDGGCGMNRDGQLNLLVLPHLNCSIDSIECCYFDGFPTCYALTDQSPSDNSINISYNDNVVRILNIDNDSVMVEHIANGAQFWLPIDYIQNIHNISVGDTSTTASCTNHQLAVSNGDLLSIIRETSHGFLVKKNGSVGWYYGKIEMI